MAEQGMKLGEAYVEIGSRDLGLQKGLAIASTATMSFIGLLTAAGAAAANFEKQMAMVHTMLLSGSQKYLGPYSTAVQRLAVTYADSTSSLTKGLYDILSATIPPARALKVLEVSAKAAAAGMTSTAVAADAITTILNSYGLASKEAADVSDMLWATVYRGKTTFEELTHQIGQAAATASLAGIALEEFGAIISTATRAGIPTARVMTSINGMLKAFLAPTKQAIRVAKQFNLVLSVSTIRKEGMLGVMKKLEKASSEELRAIFREVRGFRALAAIMMDIKGFEKDIELQHQRTGMTQKAFNKVSNTFLFILTQMKEGLRRVAVSFGTHLLPHMKKVVTWMRKFLDAIYSLSPATKRLLIRIALLVPAITTLVVALPLLVKAFKSLVNVLLMPIKSPIATLLLVLGTLMTADSFKRYKDDMKRALTSMANKIKWYADWAKLHLFDRFIAMKALLQNIWQSIQDIITRAVDAIVGKLRRLEQVDASSGIKTFITSSAILLEWFLDKVDWVLWHHGTLWNMGIQHIKKFYVYTKKYFRAVVDTVRWVGKMIEWVWDSTLARASMRIYHTFVDWPKEIAAPILKGFNTLGTGIKMLASHISTWVGNIWDKLHLKVLKAQRAMVESQTSGATGFALKWLTGIVGRKIWDVASDAVDGYNTKIRKLQKTLSGYDQRQADRKSKIAEQYRETLKWIEEVTAHETIQKRFQQAQDAHPMPTLGAPIFTKEERKRLDVIATELKRLHDEMAKREGERKAALQWRINKLILESAEIIKQGEAKKKQHKEEEEADRKKRPLIGRPVTGAGVSTLSGGLRADIWMRTARTRMQGADRQRPLLKAIEEAERQAHQDAEKRRRQADDTHAKLIKEVQKLGAGIFGIPVFG